jgi:hypothetical protein
MVWWGIDKFLPDSLDLTIASAKQSDEAMAMLAGLITYHWPAVRLSNQACSVSKKQAAAYTSDWKEACLKAGIQFDEGTAADRFMKAHSFRLSDVVIGVKSQTNEEHCLDPVTWSTTAARSNPVPDTVTMIVMSAKKAQNGNRPISRTAVASSCKAEYVICWAVGLVIIAGQYDSLDDLLLSRRVSPEYANRMGARDSKRRNLPNGKIGEIVKDIANAFGLPSDRFTANSFKIGGASSEAEKALEAAREQAQRAMHHKSAASIIYGLTTVGGSARQPR